MKMIVVGCNGEIGNCIVHTAAAAGWEVAGFDMSNDCECDAVLSHYAPVDIRDQDSVDEAIAQAVEKLDGVDCLVNSAGMLLDRSLWNTTDADLLNILNINLAGSFRLTRAVSAHMRHGAGGAIILLSSMHGALGAANRSAYAATKGGIAAFVRASAVELGPYSIRINAVAPGPVGNGMGTQTLQRLQFERSTPMRRPNSADDIAAAALFLAGDGARQITGHVLPVDAGATAVILPRT